MRFYLRNEKRLDLRTSIQLGEDLILMRVEEVCDKLIESFEEALEKEHNEVHVVHEEY